MSAVIISYLLFFGTIILVVYPKRRPTVVVLIERRGYSTSTAKAGCFGKQRGLVHYSVAHLLSPSASETASVD